ncbi:MAG TPA: hypothetical protein VGG46_05760 [Terriglobales bacterium]|jgi:hypothetical protein
MSDLERSLNQVLEDHRHESGLHVIGGQRQLLRRLMEFFEEELNEKNPQPKSRHEHASKTQ